MCYKFVHIQRSLPDTNEAVISLAAKLGEKLIVQWNHSFVMWSKNQYLSYPVSYLVVGMPHHYSEQIYKDMQYFAKFTLFFELFSTQKLTRKEIKISNIIVTLFVLCYWYIFNVFVDILEVIDCKIVIICIYIITWLPLRHRLQYKIEWVFEFIKNTNNFGLTRQWHGFYKHDFCW